MEKIYKVYLYRNCWGIKVIFLFTQSCKLTYNLFHRGNICSWSANAVKIQKHLHLFTASGLLTFSASECRRQQQQLGGPFPVLACLIMRCVCLIVYLERRTSFIDSVPDRTLLAFFLM